MVDADFILQPPQKHLPPSSLPVGHYMLPKSYEGVPRGDFETFASPSSKARNIADEPVIIRKSVSAARKPVVRAERGK